FITHPLLEGKILGIVEKKVDYSRIYGIKTYPSIEMKIQSLNDDYFNLNHQKWIFPYTKFKEKIKKLKEADAFVLPSLREGMPQSLLESMALGLVPISSKNQGAKEIIDEKNGFLFEIKAKDELKKILKDIRKINALKLRENARKTAENFSEKKVMKNIEKIYLELINKHPSKS
ncbi:glycosyltransferase, partial [Candidatus Pacearchaeota archaeon]|nr:glycosyltransferase [Candidatus Pacearchaeota archaeon]